MSGTNPDAVRLGSGNRGSGSVLAANRLVLLAAVPLFLALAVITYITIQFAANERDAQAWARHTYQVMEAERRVQADMETAESGVRGYLGAHAQAFLGNYPR